MFLCPTGFENVLPMLCCFHLTISVEHCLGKVLKDSGVEDTLLETNCLGLKIMQQVLRGTHYARYLRVMISMYEILRVFQWETFLKMTDVCRVVKCIGARGKPFAVIVLIKFYNLITFATADNANLPIFGTQPGQTKNRSSTKTTRKI